MHNNKLLLVAITILVLVNLLFPQPENPGIMKAGWLNTTLNRDGRTLSVVIYYPALNEGSNTPIDTTNKPYPIIGFGHGFAMQTSYYTSLFKHLASYGYIIIAPQFPDVNHLQLAYDLLYCVRFIKSQNSNLNSIFYRLVDTSKVGLFGHSMGGGASLLASSIDSTITVVAPLAAAETNPSVISVMSKIKSVVYLITAQNDGITPPSSNQIPMFNNANPIKAIPIIKGANHTKFMDTRIWDWTDPRGYLTASEQLRITRRYLTSIFNLFLKEDTSYFKFAFGNIALNDTSIILRYNLKPLRPKSFNLISPSDTTFVSQNKINFYWQKTFSLNLDDTIRYKILIARDSTFNNIVKIFDSLSHNHLEVNFFGEGKFYWKVIAYTSDTTQTESNFLSFNIILSNNDDKGNIDIKFELKQNYPNPFNPNTTISFTLTEDGLTKLKIYDLLGREIQTLVNEELEAGKLHRVQFDGSRLTSGVYFYKLESKSKSTIKKFMLMK
ncbi:MAG: T9SS type A sorting domain-containing protein [Ignavibacteria bacterium]|nr:T9SS type A sorting domain-containing protein [Ignavibacteria bacterium]